MHLSFPRSIMAASLLLMVVLTGCGPDFGTPVKVTGRITVDDEPLAGASVTFHCLTGLPADVRTVLGKANDQGEYELPTVYPGEYEVTVTEPQSPSAAGAMPEDPGRVAANPVPPLKPNQDMHVTVGPDKSKFDFSFQRTKSR